MNTNITRRYRRRQRERLLLWRVERAINRLTFKGIPITPRTVAREIKMPLSFLRYSYPLIFEFIRAKEDYEYKRRKENIERQLLLFIEQAVGPTKG